MATALLAISERIYNSINEVRGLPESADSLLAKLGVIRGILNRAKIKFGEKWDQAAADKTSSTSVIATVQSEPDSTTPSTSVVNPKPKSNTQESTHNSITDITKELEKADAKIIEYKELRFLKRWWRKGEIVGFFDELNSKIGFLLPLIGLEVQHLLKEDLSDVIQSNQKIDSGLATLITTVIEWEKRNQKEQKTLQEKYDQLLVKFNSVNAKLEDMPSQVKEDVYKGKEFQQIYGAQEQYGKNILNMVTQASQIFTALSPADDPQGKLLRDFSNYYSANMQAAFDQYMLETKDTFFGQQNFADERAVQQYVKGLTVPELKGRLSRESVDSSTVNEKNELQNLLVQTLVKQLQDQKQRAQSSNTKISEGECKTEGSSTLHSNETADTVEKSSCENRRNLKEPEAAPDVNGKSSDVGDDSDGSHKHKKTDDVRKIKKTKSIDTAGKDVSAVIQSADDIDKTSRSTGTSPKLPGMVDGNE